MSAETRDPRHLNETMDWSSLESYKRDYAAAFSSALENVSAEAVEKVCDAVVRAAEHGREVFVVGNGGSAAIAEHLCCDWTKGTSCENHPVIRSRSLTSNNALYSAIANDYGFERVFETQMDFFARPGDVLIAISSSGNSPNILRAVERAKSMGVWVAGFSGFSGGKLATICDASVYVATNNYGIVEDVHQAVMHVIAQYVACQRDNQMNG